MPKHNNGKNWLEIVGKEKLQTFQDAFAQTYNLGMSFEDTKGQQLTVFAKESLFCHAIQEKNEKYCQEEHINASEKVLNSANINFFTCSIGASYFVCPVFWGGEIVAYARVGCYISDHSNLPEKYIKYYHIPVFTAEQIKTISYLLTKMLELLNINYKKAYQTSLNEGTADSTIANDERLSAREQQVVALLCKGQTNKQIGETLVISEKTVKTHISNILNKLGLRDRMQVVLYFMQRKK